MATATATRRGRRTSIRWDRVGRVSLLSVLGVILLLYISPAKRWLEQSATAGHQNAEVRDLTEEHARLQARLRALKAPGAIEREARRLGMIRVGERAFAIENLNRR